VTPDDWNVAIVVSGFPGCGKTTYALDRLRREMARTPLYVVAHDPKRDLSRKGGATVKRYVGEAQLEAALRSPETSTGIHCLDVGDPMRVLRFVRGLARRASALGVPVLAYFDEAAALRGMSPSYIDPDVQEGYLGRRHELVGYVLATQRLQVLHPVILENASELVVFRTNKASQLRRLDELGLGPRALATIQRLPDHHHVVVPVN